MSIAGIISWGYDGTQAEGLVLIRSKGKASGLPF